MSVAETIMEDLRRARDGWTTEGAHRDIEGWVCGSYWYGTYRPTFSQRISELNRSGYEIASEPCPNPVHRGTIYRYRLVKDKAAAPERAEQVALL